MASRMFEVIGGQDQRRGDPKQMIQAMRSDYQRFIRQQDRNADPEAMIEQGLRNRRFSPQQVQMARQLAAQYGPMLMRR